MRQYITTNIVDIFCGMVGLDENQAQSRAGNLRKIANGVYDVLTPVQFKAGEKLNLDNPDKVTLENLEDLTQEPIKEVIKKPVAKVKKAVKKKAAKK